MITRCPACHTAFRVTENQLAARDGQVRCGACTHVFDAAAHLQEGMPAPEATTSIALPVSAAESPTIWPELVNAPGLEPVVASVQNPDDALTPATTTGGTSTEFPFGPAAKPPTRRGPWSAAILMLVLMLAAQGLFYFRSDIALLVPESKPLLKDACALLGCTISLPQRSDLMTIEASDLQADGVNPNVVILSASLRNRAAFPQALPALELTLTDTQDLPLARRVLLAADYLDSPPDNGNGFAAGAERAIRVTLQLADIKATGYRLYLFYP